MNISELIPYLKDDALQECLSTDAFIVPFYPYSSVLPFRPTFRVDDIDLIKVVAESGLQVTIPQLKKDLKREVVLQKHFDFSNPLVLFLVAVPFNILESLVTSLAVYLATKDRSAGILIINLNKNGEVDNCYNESGKIVSFSKAQDIISKHKISPLYTKPNPNSNRPVPIHL